jgi:hypothetical protein
MDAVDLLRQQADMTEHMLTDVFAKVTPENALWKLPGATTNPISTTFLHCYVTEDRVVHRLQNRPMLFESANWQERLDIDPAAIWTLNTCPDLSVCRAYAADVHAASVSYLDELDPATLSTETRTPFGPYSLAALLGLILGTNKFLHAGEISALLGCQGEQGFLF